MKKIRLYWIGGQTEVVEGKNFADACRRAGYGAGAMSVLDFYDTKEEQDYVWDSEKKMWINSIQQAINNNHAFDNNTEL